MLKKFTFFLFAVIVMGATQAQEVVEKKSRGSMNPDISFNALMLYKTGSRTNTIKAEEPNGFSLQEAELALYSEVDPYTRLFAVLTIGQEATAKAAPETGFNREYKIEPEELYFETTALTGVTIKGGKIKAALGKENQIHTHAWAFIDQSAFLSSLLGGEGLNEFGLSASALIPVSWFSEFTLQALYPHNDDSEALFNSPRANIPVSVERLKNMWDLNDKTTFEVNLSAAQGVGQSTDVANTPLYQANNINLYGSDITLKWREDKSRALIWTTEYLQSHHGTFEGNKHNYGVTSYLLFQLTERWWLGARAEYVETKVVDSAVATFEHLKKYSAIASFNPSEFSSFRLQVDQMNDKLATPERRALLQMNFTIGAHPAHAY
jgi:hypothetical protein